MILSKINDKPVFNVSLEVYTEHEMLLVVCLTGFWGYSIMVIYDLI